MENDPRFFVGDVISVNNWKSIILPQPLPKGAQFREAKIMGT